MTWGELATEWEQRAAAPVYWVHEPFQGPYVATGDSSGLCAARPSRPLEVVEIERLMAKTIRKLAETFPE